MLLLLVVTVVVVIVVVILPDTYCSRDYRSKDSLMENGTSNVNRNDVVYICKNRLQRARFKVDRILFQIIFIFFFVRKVKWYT